MEEQERMDWLQRAWAHEAHARAHEARARGYNALGDSSRALARCSDAFAEARLWDGNPDDAARTYEESAGRRADAAKHDEQALRYLALARQEREWAAQCEERATHQDEEQGEEKAPQEKAPDRDADDPFADE